MATYYYNYNDIGFTLYPTHRKVDIGNLVLRHSVPHYYYYNYDDIIIDFTPQIHNEHKVNFSYMSNFHRIYNFELRNSTPRFNFLALVQQDSYICTFTRVRMSAMSAPEYDSNQQPSRRG